MQSHPPLEPFVVDRLTATDAASFRTLRVGGLREYPEAFGASWKDEERWSDDQFADLLTRNFVMGSRTADHHELIGIVGLGFSQAAKLRHKATLWGLYVLPVARRTGVGKALIAAAISHAAGHVEEILLKVGRTNLAARALYRQAGFLRYGIERRALKVDNEYHDEVLMFLRCNTRRASPLIC